jgi:hypothetical protein
MDATDTQIHTDTETLQPLTLSEQLDAMLMGWLERRADRHTPERLDTRAAALITIADHAVPEVEEFCARWNMTAERTAPADGRFAVLRVDGPALPVQGFTEITGMYRA